MFLDDKLIEIESKDVKVAEKASMFLHAMTENMEKSVISNNGTVKKQDLVNVVKRIDDTWRRFAEKYVYNPDFFRNQSEESICRVLGEEWMYKIGWTKKGGKE